MVRRAVPVGRSSDIGEAGLVLPPRPKAWPNSWVTVVWKSYWFGPICVGSAPAYQFHPSIIVISLAAGLKQPRTPLVMPPLALVVPASRTMLATLGSLTSEIVTL